MKRVLPRGKQGSNNRGIGSCYRYHTIQPAISRGLFSAPEQHGSAHTRSVDQTIQEHHHEDLHPTSIGHRWRRVGWGEPIDVAGRVP